VSRRPKADQTVLQRQLAGGAPAPKATAIDVFALARARFTEGERVEMSALAEELGLNRVTVYRWVGSREQLLVELLWSLAEPTLDYQREHVKETGAERIVEVMTNFIVAVLSNAGMSRFVSEEGELAMRVLTRADLGFEPRLMDWLEDLLREEVAAGRLELPGELDDCAYALVRVLEAYIMLDMITGEEPDPRRAGHILRLILT
jgi:AcrR family transcriptional regulator